MKSIRIVAITAIITLMAFSVQAQKDKSKRPSPPAQVTKIIGETTITIDYSQPSKRGREIFGGLEKYGRVWRTGANETSWIELSGDVKIEGEELSAGKYGLFTIPGENEWIIIFNEKWDGWGAYKYNEEEDVLRVTVPSGRLDEPVEKFTISIADDGEVSLAWDQTKVGFTIE